MSEQQDNGLLGNFIWPIAAIAGVGVVALAVGVTRSSLQPQQTRPPEAVNQQAAPKPVAPTPTPTLPPSPIVVASAAPTPAPSPSQMATPEGFWVETLPQSNYAGWNLRSQPRGEVVGFVPNGFRLYTDNRVYGRWLSVLCPDGQPCQGQWVWIAIAGTKEVTPYAN